MRFFASLLVLSWLANYSDAQESFKDQLTDTKIPMIRTAEQTYSVTVDFTDKPEVKLDYLKLLFTANACFNWLKDQDGLTTSGSRIALVACVGGEASRKAFCASTPRKEQHKFFTDLLKAPQAPDSVAPRWETAVRVPGRSNWAHAEDFAHYLFEQATDLAPWPGTMYPPGTAVAVWSSKSPGEAVTGRAYYPCQPGRKVPSCVTVAKNLGVIHADKDPYKNLVNPQGDPPPNPLVGRSLFSALSNHTNWERSETGREAEQDPVLLPMPDSDDFWQALQEFDQKPPRLSEMNPVEFPQPEDIYDWEELDAGVDPSTYVPPHIPAPTLTPPKCSLYRGIPTQGGEDQYCLCTILSETKTLPTMSVGSTAGNDALCAYTTFTDPPAPTSTGSATTTGAAVSVAAATKGVHVGVLTSNALYTSVSSALEEICPDPTQTTSSTMCSGTATIKDVPFVEAGFLNREGELLVTVDFSSYNVTSLKTAMINSLATSAQQTATKKNCYTAHYNVERKRRSWPPSFSLFARDNPFPDPESTTMCSMAEAGKVDYYVPNWRTAPKPGPTDQIVANYYFHVEGGEFGCVIEEAFTAALAVIAPQFAVEDLAVEEVIEPICAAIS